MESCRIILSEALYYNALVQAPCRLRKMDDACRPPKSQSSRTGSNKVPRGLLAPLPHPHERLLQACVAMRTVCLSQGDRRPRRPQAPLQRAVVFAILGGEVVENSRESAGLAEDRGVAQPGLERYLGVVEVAGSNPVTPTIFDFEPFGENVEGLSLCSVDVYVAQSTVQTNRIQYLATDGVV